MDALLVLDNEKCTNVRVLVTVKQRKLKEQVITLLEENRGREAFDLLKSRADFKAYLPRGSKLPMQPQVTLFEDML
jgi:hypothetical protein